MCKWNKAYKAFVTGLLFFWIAMLVYLSGVPNLFAGTHGWILRKLGHSLMYGVLTLLAWLFLSLFAHGKFMKMLSCFGIVLLLSLYDEVHQISVPGRCGNIKGILFDLLGMVIVLAGIHIINGYREVS